MMFKMFTTGQNTCIQMILQKSTSIIPYLLQHIFLAPKLSSALS